MAKKNNKIEYRCNCEDNASVFDKLVSTVIKYKAELKIRESQMESLKLVLMNNLNDYILTDTVQVLNAGDDLFVKIVPPHVYMKTNEKELLKYLEDNDLMDKAISDGAVTKESGLGSLVRLSSSSLEYLKSIIDGNELDNYDWETVAKKIYKLKKSTNEREAEVKKLIQQLNNEAPRAFRQAVSDYKVIYDDGAIEGTIHFNYTDKIKTDAELIRPFMLNYMTEEQYKDRFINIRCDVQKVSVSVIDRETIDKYMPYTNKQLTPEIDMCQ